MSANFHKKILCGCRKIFVNPQTGDVWQTGDVYTRENLAKTLEKIAKEGDKAFYEGEIAKNLVKDLQSLGGILTEDDLRDYK